MTVCLSNFCISIVSPAKAVDGSESRVHASIWEGQAGENRDGHLSGTA